METIREYLLSVTCAAIVCGIVSALTDECNHSGLLRMVCGTFLMFTIIGPLFQPDFISLPLPGDEIVLDAEKAVLEGVDYAAQARARIIKEQLEAYIMDKASGLDARIRTEITLSKESTPTPERVEITGTWTPGARAKLERILEQDLGIAKEHQIWMESSNG